jgi:hypothetical protein
LLHFVAFIIFDYFKRSLALFPALPTELTEQEEDSLDLDQKEYEPASYSYIGFSIYIPCPVLTTVASKNSEFFISFDSNILPYVTGPSPYSPF